MFGDSLYAYLLESLIVIIPMALIIFLVLRFVWSRDDLKVEVNPKTKQLGPPHLCRGGWHEGELRGCQHGYGTTGMPVEPINTYTNLAYLAAGWVALRSVGGGPATVFFVAMAFLCFGSAIYHGVKTRWSARWDHGGMYAVMGGLAFYVVVIGHPWEAWITLAGAALGGIALAWFLEGKVIARMALLLALISVGVFTSGNSTLGLYSLGLFVAAIIVWLTDKYTGVLGRVGHGLWHVLTAAGIAVMFAAIPPTIAS
jgi:predicted membrane channel-forming protein YqfA (hemolysin III family)